jgi:predicted amidohydrolase YtcJ
VQPTVYAGARFHTLDDALGTVEALAVRGERIVAAGTTQACRDAAGPGAVEVDLGGTTVVPGLVDSHLHTAQYARSLVSVDLHTATSLQQALEAVRTHADRLPPEAWVTGGGWDCHRWPVPVQPNRHDLDTVVPDRPVALPTIDRHTLWVNSVALQRAGIDRHTPDPAGGEIVRDADGEPTGILREAAGSLIVEPDDQTALPGLLRSAMDRLLSHGLTGVHDIDGADAWSAFQTLRAADDMPIRVHKLIPRVDLDAHIDAGHATGDGDAWLRTGPVKLFTDGALGSHSCLMTHGFADEPDNHGIAVTPYPELRELVLRAGSAGIAVAAHAIGDAANHLLIDAFAEAITARPGSPLRYRIEHTQYLQPADVQRIARLGIVASMQPTHCTSDIALTDSMLAGQDLACYAWRSLLDAGAVVTFGSDAPVEDPNPWLGIHAAVTRQRADASPAGGWQPHERITLDQALRGYTVAPAYASYSEHLAGRLRPGMLADFAVLADDPFAIETSALHSVRVSATVVGGRVRWSS